MKKKEQIPRTGMDQIGRFRELLKLNIHHLTENLQKSSQVGSIYEVMTPSQETFFITASTLYPNQIGM